MGKVDAIATPLAGGLHSGTGFASDADAFAAFVICLAIAVAVFELVRGAWDRRRIKVRRKN